MSEEFGLFSLEDDDCSELFIKQESRKSENNDEKSGNFNWNVVEGMQFGIAEDDFQSSCQSVISGLNNPMYSDISDDEDIFEDSKNEQNTR